MEERWNRFVENVGGFGIFRLAIVILAIGLIAVGASLDGWAVVLILGVPLAVLLGYFLQSPMTRNIQTTRKVMNTFATLVLFSLLLPNEIKQSDWVIVSAPILLALYISSYFWFMSHPDIYIER